MKQKLFMMVCVLLTAMTVGAQPLLKTHVETGDVEGVLEDGGIACYYAIPYAAPPVGDLMQQYWVNFAKTGNPNGEGLPEWTVYDEQKPSVMQFKDGATLIPLPNKEKIQLIDRFMQYIRNLQSGKVAQ